MGCHTWFYRPLNTEEVESLRPYAKKEILELMSDEHYPKSYLRFDQKMLEAIDTPNNYIWLKYGYGGGDNCVTMIKGKPYLELSYVFDHGNVRFNIPKFFLDVFRLPTYPNWIIHNKKELRRKMKRKYFELTKEQHQRLNEFWQIYPGGVIMFG